ncbi:diguanylate cyclase/phosphodiesterase [Deinococcus reticulitermitis]|uniref:Diguanylate cyclase/phosphodiesterase n=1 Tax=Deinococcus reticulitermitis TaxID=856736 RepID=A0A1H6WI07_9DEIO|nr:EAL domain-containing protein [Deinococcus reticulitermitis]SEJ15346.1 diguanylate cyclase/phosphodiesterase [Deinococcus reticulitermitis]
MPASPALIDAAFELTLRDLLRVLAPHATLLADLGPRVVRLRAGEALVDTGGDDLVPPDEWLEQGELAWLTRDGALLGLLWNEQGAVPASAVEMLTLLLAATRREGVGREADMLITQLPTPTAWLGADLTFRRVSRTFLGAFGLTEGEVLGRTVQSVFTERFLWQRQLEAAAAGRSVQLSDEAFVPGSVAPLPPEQPGETPRWLRGEAKPYFGGAAAGVLWTVQDVTGEHVRRAEVEALLGTELPLALLTPMGTVTAASRGLSALLGEGGEGGGSGGVGGSPAAGSAGPGHPGTPLHSWSCFAPEGARTMQDLVDQALAGRRASAEVALARGGGLRLTARPVAGGARGLLIEGVASEAGGPEQGPTASQLLRLSEAATVLLDHQGRIQHVSEQVAHLLGIDVTPLTGLLLARAAQQLGLRLHTPSGRALEVPELRTLEPPAEREVLLLLPGGVSRQLGVRLSSVEPSGGRKAGMLLTLRDVTALRRTQAKLRHDASHDALTGLLNRPGLRAALGPLDAGQTGDALAAGGTVVGLDIDGFGALNAALGRTAGDLLLIQVAARLNDLATQEGGRAARLADDTFALYLPGLGAEIGAQKVQAALREPLRAGKRVVPVTFALGAAALSGPAPDFALADAEVALQHAKRQGRGCVKVFEPGLRDEEAESFKLEEGLRAVLAGERQAEQFSLLYQPAVSLKDGRVLGAEALLRWTHPELGNVSPARFLPIASRSDLITAIGEWVVREAGRGRAQVREATRQRDWRTSVNLSLEELRREGALERLLPLTTRGGALDVEVSAGSLIDHSAETLGLLEGLRARGARLLVDDFGDGASSLTALTRFPLSGVKLHPTLTARLPGDPKSLTLVQGTVDLAHSLGLSVTAVGVETYAQLDVLRDLGCDAAQGYALTPPLSAGDLIQWLRSR